MPLSGVTFCSGYFKAHRLLHFSIKAEQNKNLHKLLFSLYSIPDSVYKETKCSNMYIE